MRAKAQIDKKGSALTREDMARHLGAHLCRCTGYVKILDAIEKVAAGGGCVEPPRPGGVGSRGTRYQAEALALGDRDYIDDLRPARPAARRPPPHRPRPGRCHQHRHRPRREAAPGVVAVLTAADIPGDLRVGIIHRDWPVMIPEGGRTSYAGDVLAVVVAETPPSGQGGGGAGRRGLPAAGADDRARSDAMASTELAVWGTDGNVLSRSAYARGDVDAALGGSAHVVTEVFETQRVEHAFLEPESTLAVPRPDGGLHVYSGGQGVWDDRDQIASVLGVERGPRQRGAGL